MTDKPVKTPNGKGTVTPYVVVKGAAQFLDFVKQAFDAKEMIRVPNPDGTIGHAEFRIGNSIFMVFDAKPNWPDTPSFLSMYVDDADAVFAKALAAGAEKITEVTISNIIGDRGGRVRDPLGNIWWIQTHFEDVSPDEIAKRFQNPTELSVMQKLQASFEEEMNRRSRV